MKESVPPVEPTDALRAIEVALRLAVRQVLGAEWIKAKGAPDREKLVERQEAEAKRRDGTVVSEELLDYTETYHLTELIKKNWESFNPVFDDKKRTEVFFGVIEDVRNSIAHSRDLVPFERDLIAGVAGLLRNQVALYRSSIVDAAAQHYPLIESLNDSFGRDGCPLAGPPGRLSRIRLEVGDVITFVGKATDPRGREIAWHVGPEFWPTNPVEVGRGPDVTFSYVVTEKDVGEDLQIAVHIRSSSKYHRHGSTSGRFSHDDGRRFFYAVNPPLD
jgi:hypothetical protein